MRFVSPVANKKLNKGSSGQNRKASETYMAKYRQGEGVLETDNGVLYRVLEDGSGISPTAGDSVTVNQRILTVDGRVIADTYKVGMPDTFTMKEAIPGVRELLLIACEGGRYEFVVPPDLAWGKRGATNKIGPNAALVFDMRLIEVKF